MNKQILHLDMDAFFASVEQATNPSLKHQPVIVGSRANRYIGSGDADWAVIVLP